MLSDSFNSNLYPEWLSHVKSETAKDAFRYLVGAAALLKKYTCHVQSKGVVKDFRFIDQNNEQPFAFIVNMQWLLFYFRAPSIRSGSYALDELQDSFPLASKNNRGEWTIRIHNIQEARVLMNYLELEYRSRSTTKVKSTRTSNFMVNQRSRQIILLLFIAMLCGCQLFDPSAEQIVAVKALGAASEACVYDVRDKNIKYEASKNCNSMSPLAQQYINAGGGRPDTNLKAEIEFERARVQAWMALALSASNGEASRIW